MSLRYLIVVAIASFAIMASAQVTSDPMYMVLTMKDGSFKAVNVDNVNRLTFTSGKMNVENKNATTETFFLSDISNMEFSNTESSGLERISTDYNTVTYNYSDQTIIVKGVKGGLLNIYNAQGATMLTHTTVDGIQTIDITALQSGVYVITYNGQSLKIKK